jgi:hypothetical protein
MPESYEDDIAAKTKLLHKQAQEAQELFMAMAPMMFGHDPGVQGNVLSMLLGTWLAGHFVTHEDEAKAIDETRKIRARLLTITTRAAFLHAASQDQQRDKPEEARQ